MRFENICWISGFVLIISLSLLSEYALSDYEIQPVSGGLVFDESLSTESYEAYVNESSGQKLMVIDSRRDVYRLDNGSFEVSDYSINIDDFVVNKSRFDLRFGGKTPSINFSYGRDSLKFAFVGYGLYDLDDGDYVLLKGHNDIVPEVFENSVVYANIIDSIDISYNVNKSGINKLITFVNKTRDSLPGGYSDNTYIVFVERIDGDYPRLNSSFRELWFKDVMIPDLDDVYKKVITKGDVDYLLTAIKFGVYNSSEFPFSIDPTLSITSGTFFGSTGDLSGSGDGYSDIEITGGGTVNIGASNCTNPAVESLESDCSWYVNISGYFYIEPGTVLEGSSRGRYGGSSASSGLAGGVGKGGKSTESGGGNYAGGGGAGSFNGGGTGGDISLGTPGAGGSAYNTTVPANYGGLWPPWAGSGGGSGTGEDAESGGDGGSGVYIEASNISIGTIKMNGETAKTGGGQLKGTGGGGSGGSLILRAHNSLSISTGAVSSAGGAGGAGCSGCQPGWPGSTGGGGSGGVIEVHYANIYYNNASAVFNASLGGGGTCIDGYPGDCSMGNPGGAGSIYINQFNIPPNFTVGDGPRYEPNVPIVGGNIELSVNVSAQTPFMSPNDNIKECNFSVWHSVGGADYYDMNNSNASWALDSEFNYTFNIVDNGVHYWNATCYDDDGFSTLLDGSTFSNFDPSDTEIPTLEILSPVEGEAFFVNSVVLAVNVTDNVQFTVKYNWGGPDCGTPEHSGCEIINQTFPTTATCSITSGGLCNKSIILNATVYDAVEYFQFYVIADDGTNINDSTINFTVSIPSPGGDGAPPSGGGGAPPAIQAITPFCGDGVCQAESAENIFSCWVDCATLSRLQAGDIFKEAIVLRRMIFLGFIVVLLLLVDPNVWSGLYRSAKGYYHEVRGKF